MPAAVEVLTTPEVCQVAGATYRMVDYWCRVGVLDPVRNGAGSGCPRAWTVADANEARVCAVLAQLGAQCDVMRAVLTQLDDSPAWWDTAVVVGVNGAMHAMDDPKGVTYGWLVDLALVCEAVRLAIADLVGEAQVPARI